MKGGWMIVDCHTHINLAGDDAETRERLAGTETVDACIVLAAPDGPSEEVNKKLSEYVTGHSDKMVGFAVLDPPDDKIGFDSLRAIQESLRLDGVLDLWFSSGK
jgi:5S rRNA maturation endonuclease (ribonuclease M5)